MALRSEGTAVLHARGRGLSVLACLLPVLAAGCAALAGEPWEVKALEPLSRGVLSVQASSRDHTLHVTLTLHPPAAEDAYVTDVFLTRHRAAIQEGGRTLPADDVRPLDRYHGPIGVGFVYSSGDVDRYVARHTSEGYYGTGGSIGPQRLQATWTLVGPWAEASELELVAVVAVGVYPRTGERIEHARFRLLRPRSSQEVPFPENRR